jgi:hypothetical protein
MFKGVFVLVPIFSPSVEQLIMLVLLEFRILIILQYLVQLLSIVETLPQIFLVIDPFPG